MIDGALEAAVCALATRYALGAVGVVPGAPDAPARLMVAVPLDDAEAFACAVSETLGREVQLYSFTALPYTHPFFLLVRWLNVVRLPRRPVPRGATVRAAIRAGEVFVHSVVRLNTLPHFFPSDGPVALGSGEACRSFARPPLGAFLL